MAAQTQSVQTQEKAVQTQNQGQQEAPRRREVFLPRADVLETGDSIIVTADMPGVKEEDIDITLEKNVLTLTGRTVSPERKGYRLAYGEYTEGDYERSFALSEGVDKEGIEATMSNGVLRLTLPKAKEAAARKIPVRAG